MPYAVPAKCVKYPEQVADPKGHDDYHNEIQYRLDGPLHGNESVHKPKQHAHRNKCENNIHKWQRMLPSKR